MALSKFNRKETPNKKNSKKNLGGEKKEMNGKDISYIKIGKTTKRIVTSEGAFGYSPGNVVTIEKIPNDGKTKSVKNNKNNGKWTVLGTNHHHIHVGQEKKLYLEDNHGNITIITEENKETLKFFALNKVLFQY